MYLYPNSMTGENLLVLVYQDKKTSYVVLLQSALKILLIIFVRIPNDATWGSGRAI